MSVETVRVDWINDQVFLLRDRAGFPIIMTQPSGINGADLLPLSVIGCAGWDLVSILKKQRQRITAVQVTAESIRDEEPPWRFRSIHIHYNISGRSLKEEVIRRAIKLSEQKYCSTLATLRDAVEIVSDYQILREEDELAA